MLYIAVIFQKILLQLPIARCHTMIIFLSTAEGENSNEQVPLKRSISVLAPNLMEPILYSEAIEYKMTGFHFTLLCLEMT